MKTNNKKARENVRKYIIANFTPEDYTDNPPQEFPEIAGFILSTFRTEEQAENALTFLIYRELVGGVNK